MDSEARDRAHKKGALMSADEHVLTDRGGKLYGTHPALREDHDKEMDVEPATGSALQEDIAATTRALLSKGQDILGRRLWSHDDLFSR